MTKTFEIAWAKTNRYDHLQPITPESVANRESWERRTSHQEIARRETVFTSDDSIRLVVSRLIQGFNKKSGKNWTRWESLYTYGLRRTSTGKLVATYSATVKGKKKYFSPLEVWNFLSFDEKEINLYSFQEGRIEFVKRAKEMFGEVSFASQFPMAVELKQSEYSYLPSGSKDLWRTKNFREFVEVAFGKSRYRKDLMKAVAGAVERRRLNDVMYVKEFRGLVPTDWIVSALNQTEYKLNPYNEQFSALRAALHLVQQTSRKNLLFTVGRASYTRPETLRMVGEYGANLKYVGKVRDWQELHDAIDKQVRDIRLPKNKIKQIAAAKRIDKKTDGRLTLVTAKHTQDLADWGDEQSICIGSYAQQALDGRGVYGAVYEGETLLANFEVVGGPGQLKQLLGKFNKPLADQDIAAVESLLKEAEVIIPERYWGSSCREGLY